VLPPAVVPARSWLSGAPVAGAALALLTAALVCQTRSTPSRRVAIRVTCDDAAACDRIAAEALDVWSEAHGPGAPLDVVVLEDALPRLDVPWHVLVPDIDAEARAEQARLRSPAAARPGDWFADYRDYRAITTYLHDLAASFPDRAAVEGIGSTLDGRSIWALRIGHGETPMLVNGTQHAREWISAMVSMCVADRLIRGYDSDPKIRDFVDHTELWVVPVANPDGYQHTWASDRYWRKNRRGGYGVDLNRNYDVAWGGDGSSGWKRSDVYRGEAPFSEPETRALRDLAKRERVALHLDFHAYGQLILYPWGHTATPAPDRDRYAAVGDRVASAIFAEHENRYRLMSSVELYRASGTMTDWMYGEAGAFSYTIELRPRGRGGFVLPPSEIRPTCDEGLAAVLALRYSLQ
jgi:murein tripeptide amidase MpaA